MPQETGSRSLRRIIGRGFHDEVYRWVRCIPKGRLSTYGDIARALGSVVIARRVGDAMAALPSHRRDVPWQRVVNSLGCVSPRKRDPNALEQRRRLAREGIRIDERGRVIGFVERRLSFEKLVLRRATHEMQRPDLVSHDR